MNQVYLSQTGRQAGHNIVQDNEETPSTAGLYGESGPGGGNDPPEIRRHRGRYVPSRSASWSMA